MPCIWNTDICRYDQRSFTEPIHDNIKLLLVSVKTIYCLQDVYWVHIWQDMVHINKTQDISQKYPNSRENSTSDIWRFCISLLKGHLRTTNMTQLKWCLYPNTKKCPHDVYWVHIWPDMTYQWNSGYVSEMFCFVTYQYQLNISPKTGLMEKSVLSIFYMSIFDDIWYRYCHYSTQNMVSVYSYILQ